MFLVPFGHRAVPIPRSVGAWLPIGRDLSLGDQRRAAWSAWRVEKPGASGTSWTSSGAGWLAVLRELGAFSVWAFAFAFAFALFVCVEMCCLRMGNSHPVLNAALAGAQLQNWGGGVLLA